MSNMTEQQKANATLVIKGRNARGFIEAAVDVESGNGWLGGCIVFGRDVAGVESAAYAEADRRAEAAGCRLETMRRAA